MEPKPEHLGPEYAAQFKDLSIAEAYHNRPPYPAEVFDKLTGLITDQPRVVLDVGCGTGDLARRLVEHVERIDAIDFSEAMLAQGKQLPGGDHPRLHWIYGPVETVALQPPYALITAGESLHWMEWEIVFPLFRRILTPHGYLALVERGAEHDPWDDELREIIPRFATNRKYRPYNLVEELEQRHLFQQQGEISTHSVVFVQPVDAYIASFHSMNGFSRERMGEEMAHAFDNEVRNILTPFQQEGQITRRVIGHIVWGNPLMPALF